MTETPKQPIFVGSFPQCAFVAHQMETDRTFPPTDITIVCRNVRDGWCDYHITDSPRLRADLDDLKAGCARVEPHTYGKILKRLTAATREEVERARHAQIGALAVGHTEIALLKSEAALAEAQARAEQLSRKADRWISTETRTSKQRPDLDGGEEL